MRVLVVEDEVSIAGQLAVALREGGYAVDVAHTAKRADELVFEGIFDAVILDLGLPGADGLTLLRAWRAAGLRWPILILTARGSWHEKVQGIDGGADDYMGKPFRVEEVLARIRALIRRASSAESPEFRLGDISLDTRTARVTLGGNPVRLTGHEYRVLAYLLHQKGRVVSRGELTEHIYAQDFDRDSNTVEVFVARLRRKLGAGCIETVRGLGYRVNPE